MSYNDEIRYKETSTTSRSKPSLKLTVPNGTFVYDESQFWVRQFGLGTRAQLTQIHHKNIHGEPPSDDEEDDLRFQQHVLFEVNSSKFPVNHTSFRPYPPHEKYNKQMAVSSGPRVSLYPLSSQKLNSGLRNIEPDRNISLSDVALCTSYRADGRLLAIGIADGSIRVVDIVTKATLKTFIPNETHHNRKASKSGTRSVMWWRDGKTLTSAGDDGLLRVWGLSMDKKPLLELRGHGDTIRCCTQVKTNQGRVLAVSGSYDHTIRIWDLSRGIEKRTDVQESMNQEDDFCVTVLDHGSPVEEVLVLPTKDNTNEELFILSAGGTSIKMWNALTGALISSIESHAKTISTLFLVSPAQLNASTGDGESKRAGDDDYRLLSGGIDGLLRIYSISLKNLSSEVEGNMLTDDNNNIGRLKPIHGIKHKNPITHISMTPDGMRLIVGTSDGVLSVRHRSSIKQSYIMKNKKRKMIPKIGTYSYFYRGSDNLPDPEDHVVVYERRKKLSRFDNALKKFRHGDALDDALSTKSPGSVSNTKHPYFL